jgi:predicted extracellular nuclease
MKRILRAMVALATTASVIVTPALTAGAVVDPFDQVFISEIHYDNASADAGEAIEIFGPAGTDLAGWTVVLYNGSATVRAPYDTIALSGVIPDQSGGFGVLDFARAGIQNGNPDGLALVDAGGALVQFLSYGGTFDALSGVATGETSTDIGVAESGSTAVGDSLQLAGTGSCYGDFAWQAPAPNSFGALGPITIGDCDPDLPDPDPEPEPLPDVRFSEIHYDNVGTDAGEAIEVFGPAGTDLSGWSVVLYNGSGGAAYGTTALSGVIPNLNVGFGVVTLTYPANGIQNGSPDGMALVDATATVVEFLSYEGSITATDGPALGLTSTDIGVSETGSTLIGFSLQRDIDGAWYGPVCNSFGVVNDPNAIDPCSVMIHDVQGSGTASPIAGHRVTVEGIVVGDHEGPSPALGGFFVQEEDVDADTNPSTSEGVFVFNGSADSVSIGDLVRVTGTVQERFNHTQLSGFAEIEVLDTGQELPTPAVVTFPLTSVGALENVEGMLATFPQELVISEFFNYDRFGEIVVSLPASGEERAMNPTALFHEDSAEAAARRDLNIRSRITVDDGITDQNAEAPIHPINREPFSQANAFRGGDTVGGLTGPVFFDFNLFRVLPYATEYSGLTGFDTYERTTPPASPDDVGGDLTVAAFNALNYFTTLDTGAFICGPNLDLECRGADDANELQRQRVKLLNTLEAMGADVVGLIEVENTAGVEPLADLVNGLNDRLGAGTYAYVAAGDNSAVGTDAIKVGIIYKPGSVMPLGDAAVLDTPDFLDPVGSGTDRNRAAVAQTFVENASGEVFSVVVNHLKSKGSSCGAGDDHPLGGNCNLTRTLAATVLTDWIDTDPTGIDDDDWLIIGDLNSYDHETPIATIETAGYTDLIAEYEGEYAYSFVFDGEVGYLDYAMSSASMTSQVTGATVWNINADEPDIFDYDTTFKSDYQDALFDPATPFRSSDHDPVIVGLSLESSITVTAEPDSIWPPNHKLVEIELSATDGSSAVFDVDALEGESTEADSGLGTDDIPGDIVIEDGDLWLRAERYSSDGRTYTVTVVVVGNGQTYFTQVQVDVDHDQRESRGGR